MLIESPGNSGPGAPVAKATWAFNAPYSIDAEASEPENDLCMMI